MRTGLRPLIACLVVSASAPAQTTAAGAAPVTPPVPARVTLVREATIAGANADLGAVNGGHVNARGDVALTIRRDYQARIYDASGGAIATIGRRGNGPGEFQVPQVQGWTSDTVWVYDVALRRHSFFTRAGQLVRVTPLETTQREIPITNAGAGAVLADFFPQGRRPNGEMIGSGTVAHRAVPGAGAAAGGRALRERALVRYSSTGTAIRLASLDPDPRWDSRLAFTTFSAVAPDASAAVIVSVTDLTPTGSQVVVTRVDSGGRVTSTARVPYRGIPYSMGQRDSLLRTIDPRDGPRPPASRVPGVRVPVYGAFLRDDGVAMLTVHEPTHESTSPSTSTLRVVMVGRDGALRGEFALPRNGDLLAARGQQVWLRERDARGRTSVVRYRLRCDGRGCP